MVGTFGYAALIGIGRAGLESERAEKLRHRLAPAPGALQLEQFERQAVTASHAHAVASRFDRAGEAPNPAHGQARQSLTVCPVSVKWQPG